MDAYSNANYISVRKSTYTDEVTPKQNRTQSPCEYERTHKNTAVTKKNEGFTYVEHCGVKGTFRDVFYTKKIKGNEKSSFDKIVTILLFAVLLFFVAGSYCEYLDTFNDIKRLESEMGECREQQTKLLMAIQERDSKLGIEEYAINELGMVKSEKLTRHYVNISSEDVVKVSEAEEADTYTGGVLLSGFRSILSNLVEDK